MSCVAHLEDQPVCAAKAVTELKSLATKIDGCADPMSIAQVDWENHKVLCKQVNLF